MPACLSNHWMLIRIRMKEKRAIYYDSLNHMDMQRRFEAMTKVILIRHKQWLGCGEWTHTAGICQQQNDFVSCGVFVIWVVHCLLINQDTANIRVHHQWLRWQYALMVEKKSSLTSKQKTQIGALIDKYVEHHHPEEYELEYRNSASGIGQNRSVPEHTAVTLPSAPLQPGTNASHLPPLHVSPPSRLVNKPLGPISPQTRSILHYRPTKVLAVCSHKSQVRQEKRTPLGRREEAVHEIIDDIESALDRDLSNTRKVSAPLESVFLADPIPSPGNTVKNTHQTKKGFVRLFESCELGDTMLLAVRGIEGLSIELSAWLSFRTAYAGFRVTIAIEDRSGRHFELDKSMWIINPSRTSRYLVFLLQDVFDGSREALHFQELITSLHKSRKALQETGTSGRNENREEQHDRDLAGHIQCFLCNWRRPPQTPA